MYYLNNYWSNNYLDNFDSVNNLNNLELTCFKNPSSPCRDLFLTNRSRCFQNKTIIETVISDFHWLVEAALQRCSYKYVFWKYTVHLQENSHTEAWFQ